MPLSESAHFKTKLTARNQIQLPRILRGQNKIEAGETFRVMVEVWGSHNSREQVFLAKTSADGRLTIPKITMEILEDMEEKKLVGAIFDVSIFPLGNNKSVSDQAGEKKLLDKIQDIRKTLEKP